MDTIKETILDEFYDRHERQSCYLIAREYLGRVWYHIMYDVAQPLVVSGYSREDDARRRFAALKVQAQTE